jgi:hypothetical protein
MAFSFRIFALPPSFTRSGGSVAFTYFYWDVPKCDRKRPIRRLSSKADNQKENRRIFGGGFLLPDLSIALWRQDLKPSRLATGFGTALYRIN